MPGSEPTLVSQSKTTCAIVSTSSQDSKQRVSRGSGAGKKAIARTLAPDSPRPPGSWCKPASSTAAPCGRPRSTRPRQPAASASWQNARPRRRRSLAAHRAHRRTSCSAPTMIPGLSGSLLSHEVLAQVVPIALRGLLDEAGREPARRRLRAWHVPLRAQLGPALALRAIFDRLGEPLLRGARLSRRPGRRDGGEIPRRARAVSGTPRATLLVTPWGQHPASAWRDAVRLGIGQGERWCFCLTGPRLRIVDSSRTYSRQFVEFDLEIAIENEQTFAVLWGLLRAAAMAGLGARPAAAARPRHRADRAASRVGPHVAATGCSRRAGAPDAGVLGGWPPAHAGAGSAAATRRALGPGFRVRRSAGRHLSDPVPALCRGARPGAALASDLPRQLHHRGAARTGRDAAAAGRACGKRCRPSRGSRIAAAASARCACRRSTAGCSRPRTRRSPTRVPLDDGVVRRGAAGADDAARGAADSSASRTAISASSSSAACTSACSTSIRRGTRWPRPAPSSAASAASRPAPSTRRGR